MNNLWKTIGLAKTTAAVYFHDGINNAWRTREFAKTIAIFSFNVRTTNHNHFRKPP